MRLRRLPLKGAPLAARQSRFRGGYLLKVPSMTMDDFGFAPPPFKPDEALASLTRSLREQGLTPHGNLFERRGTAIARASVDGDVLTAARVKRPSRSSPEWQPRTLRSSADLRDFVADLKKQLAQWSDRDD